MSCCPECGRSTPRNGRCKQCAIIDRHDISESDYEPSENEYVCTACETQYVTDGSDDCPECGSARRRYAGEVVADGGTNDFRDIPEDYWYHITIEEYDGLGSGDYSAKIDQKTSGVTGLFSFTRSEIVRKIQAQLRARSEKTVTSAGAEPRKYGPVPVRVETVFVDDQTTLGIAAADLVDEQVSITRYAGGRS